MSAAEAEAEAEAGVSEQQELISQQPQGRPRPSSRAPRRLGSAAMLGLATILACTSVAALLQFRAQGSSIPAMRSGVTDAVGLHEMRARGDNDLDLRSLEAPAGTAAANSTKALLEKMYSEIDALKANTETFNAILESLTPNVTLCGKLVCAKNSTCCGAAQNGMCCGADATCCGSARSPGAEICCGKGSECFDGICCARGALQCGGICCNAGDVCCGGICGARGSECNNGVLSAR
mmetsp:Transcript_92220/g.247312  ORF Transcript_92220/g.247312 Transcript_92220/m.247312 type:complete len:236 (+) Transcript_92220:96-803(+)